MSLYCNAFTVEITLADGQGTVESASLSTTQNGTAINDKYSINFSS